MTTSISSTQLRRKISWVSRLTLSLVFLAGAMSAPSISHAQSQTLEESDRKLLLARIASYIRSNPEAACELPKREIEQYLSKQANRHGLIDSVARSVFDEGNAPLTGYAAVLEETRRKTARQWARNRAIYNGEEAPVNDTWQEPAKTYPAELNDVEAESRIENGLKCIANGRVDRLHFPISYIVFLDTTNSDGWTAQFVGLPLFTEEAALTEQSTLRVKYGGVFLTLSEAQAEATSDRADAKARKVELAMRRAEREAYRNSTAGRAEALRWRLTMAEKQNACERSGGTWGVPFDKSTIVRIDAMEVSGWIATLQGCYFLGR